MSRPAPPRVCFLMEGFYPVIHGATTQILMLGERFVEHDVETLVVTRRISPEHPAEEVLRGVRVVRVPPAVGLRRSGKFLMLLPAARTLLRLRREFDLLVISDMKVLGILGVLAARALGKPCVLRAETCGELDITEWLADNRGAHPVLARLVRLIAPLRAAWLRRADRFLSISSAITAEYHRVGVPDDQIVEITNGIDADRFAPVERSRKRHLRARLDLPADQRLFLYTGRLAEGKGLEWLLEVWRDLASEHPDAHLVLVGSGQGFAMDIEEQLRRYVRGEGLGGRVTFTGSVQNVHEYLQAADVFVLPSRSESLGIALLEAMACGLPCVATAVGGILDIVVDEQNGLLVSYGDSEGLRLALRRLLASPELAERLAERARATILERFDIHRITEEYLDLFDRLAQPTRAG